MTTPTDKLQAEEKLAEGRKISFSICCCSFYIQFVLNESFQINDGFVSVYVTLSFFCVGGGAWKVGLLRIYRLVNV